MSVEEITFPRRLRCLFEPHRFITIHGGRGGAKSWSIARSLLLRASKEKRRVLCAREIQKSLKESVMLLLEDQIEKMKLPGFRVLESEIRHRCGSRFAFAGLQGHTIQSIKSFEGVDDTWVEEGQTVSDYSWDIFTPTVIRKPGSRLIIGMNPNLLQDPTQQRFIEHPPAGSKVVQMNYYHNEFFTAELEAVRAHDEATKPREDYENIWLGKPKAFGDGTIYGRQMAMLRKLGRIGSVPPRRDVGVNVFFDLGVSKGNETCAWLHQYVGAAHRFPFFRMWAGKGLRDIWTDLRALQQEHGFRWGVFHFPHDGKNKLQGAELQDREEILREVARPLEIETVSVARTQDLGLSIDNVRGKLSDCYFDEVQCSLAEHPGIKALEQYQYEYIQEAKIYSRTPLHNWASNPADALRTWAEGYAPEGPQNHRHAVEVAYPRGAY